jgi:hypothetical protein
LGVLLGWMALTSFELLAGRAAGDGLGLTGLGDAGLGLAGLGLAGPGLAGLGVAGLGVAEGLAAARDGEGLAAAGDGEPADRGAAAEEQAARTRHSAARKLQAR